jgi:hypothetical protein
MKIEVIITPEKETLTTEQIAKVSKKEFNQFMKHQKIHERTVKQINNKTEKIKKELFFFELLKMKRDNLEKIMTDFFTE